MVACGLTKPFASVKYHAFVKQLGMASPPPTSLVRIDENEDDNAYIGQGNLTGQALIFFSKYEDKHVKTGGFCPSWQLEDQPTFLCQIRRLFRM